MNIVLDHLVHYVNDPFAIMESFGELGYPTTKGGKHDDWGTYNTLSYLKHMSYIEWIGIDRLEITQKATHPFSNQILKDVHAGEGFSQIAFRTSSMSTVEAELNQKGIKTLGPYPGSRKRPDGSILEWSMLFIKHDQPMPFFIEWGQDDREREQDLLKKGLLGAKEISSICYSVHDPVRTANLWSGLFSGNATQTQIQSPFGKEMIMAEKVEFNYFSVYFCTVPELLKTRGERPFSVRMHPNEGKTVLLAGGYYEV